MNEDTEKKIRKALKERDFIKFDEFTRLMEIIVYFSEDMDLSAIRDVINDCYTLYKEQGNPSALEYLQEHLGEVHRNSHSFWLDKRGLMIMALNSRC